MSGRAEGTTEEVTSPDALSSVAPTGWQEPHLACLETEARESGEDPVDGLPVHVGEPALDAVVVVGEFRVVDAEELQDGGVEVVPGRGVLDGLPADVVR